jgi:hypothetical protein
MKKLVLCLMTGLALTASGCVDDNLTEMRDRTDDKIKPGDVEEGEVPVGKEITLHGDVKRIYDKHTFVLSDDGYDFSEDLLVLTKDELPFTAGSDLEVKVTGIVDNFTVVEAEEEYDWDFDGDVETELEKDIEYYLRDAKIEVFTR